MRSIAFAISVVAAMAGVAAGEETHGVEIRQINTAMREIGCSPYTPQCAGATSTRTGLVVVDVTAQRLRNGPVALVGLFQGAARPDDGLLASQMIAGGGARLSLDRAWIQGGVGFAAERRAPGPKTITTTWALAHGAPALLLGTGIRTHVHDVPVAISLDAGTSLDADLAIDHPGRVYQLTANVLFTEL
ncbi:MAG TPA: hypothetical protein VLM79_13840 [Kofleriaceae bacterium]|nr:hypothetical protein [Kofleriaceae bacterium]